VLRLSGLAAAASAGLLAVCTSAGAAPISGPAVPAIAGPSQVSPKATTAQYSLSCDFSAYGGTSPQGTTATFSMPSTVTQDDAVTTTFATAALAITAPEQQKLASADALALSLTGVSVTDSTGAARHLVVYGGAAQLSVAGNGNPVIEPATSAVNALLPNLGTAHVTAPTKFTITPMTGNTALAPIPCTVTGNVHTLSVDVVATASTIPAPSASATPPAGPQYKCLVSATGLPQGTIHQTVTTPIPMTLSASGPEKTGHSILVTLSSGTDGLGAPYPLPATSLVYQGTLSVQGAQPGVLDLRRTTAQVGKSTFTVSAPLPLKRPGALRVYLPTQFTFTVVGPYYPGTHRRVDFITACSATPGPQIGLRLDVTGKAVSGGGTTEGSGTAASGAVPGGAPNTGGGAAPGSSLPLILGGAGLLLAGGGGTALALRRRRFSPPSV
jgi:hypothetical protein